MTKSIPLALLTSHSFYNKGFLRKKDNSERNFVYFCKNSLEFELFLFVPFELQKLNLLSQKLCIQSLTYNNNDNNNKKSFFLHLHKHMIFYYPTNMWYMRHRGKSGGR